MWQFSLAVIKSYVIKFFLSFFLYFPLIQKTCSVGIWFLCFFSSFLAYSVYDAEVMVGMILAPCCIAACRFLCHWCRVGDGMEVIKSCGQRSPSSNIKIQLPDTNKQIVVSVRLKCGK